MTSQPYSRTKENGIIKFLRLSVFIDDPTTVKTTTTTTSVGHSTTFTSDRTTATSAPVTTATTISATTPATTTTMTTATAYQTALSTTVVEAPTSAVKQTTLLTTFIRNMITGNAWASVTQPEMPVTDDTLMHSSLLGNKELSPAFTDPSMTITGPTSIASDPLSTTSDSYASSVSTPHYTPEFIGSLSESPTVVFHPTTLSYTQNPTSSQGSSAVDLHAVVTTRQHLEITTERRSTNAKATSMPGKTGY